MRMLKSAQPWRRGPLGLLWELWRPGQPPQHGARVEFRLEKDPLRSQCMFFLSAAEGGGVNAHTGNTVQGPVVGSACKQVAGPCTSTSNSRLEVEEGRRVKRHHEKHGGRDSAGAGYGSRNPLRSVWQRSSSEWGRCCAGCLKGCTAGCPTLPALLHMRATIATWNSTWHCTRSPMCGVDPALLPASSAITASPG